MVIYNAGRSTRKGAHDAGEKERKEAKTNEQKNYWLTLLMLEA